VPLLTPPSPSPSRRARAQLKDVVAARAALMDEDRYARLLAARGLDAVEM
jgi:hypothetical protein